MGWFSWEPKVPDTISAEQMEELSARAERASTESPLSDRSVKRIKANNEQHEKRKLS